MKPFAPSKRKLDKAREQGQLLKSQLLSQFFALLGGSIGGSVYFLSAWVSNQKLIQYCLTDPSLFFKGCTISALTISLQGSFVILISAAILGFAAEYFQTGWMFNLKLAECKLDRINPAGVFKNLPKNFKNQILRLFAGLFILLVSWSVLKKYFYTALSSPENYLLLGQSTYKLLSLSLAVGLLIFAVTAGVEYFIKRKEYYKDLSMDIEELKQEHKETESDPQMKHKRKHEHQLLMNESIIKRVKKARVILVSE